MPEQKTSEAKKIGAAVPSRVPPYLPFKTLLSSLDALSHGVPPMIDRRLWRSQSGVTQGLIMNAYRFLGLVDHDNDSSTEFLDKLADPHQRVESMRFLIEANYSDVLVGNDLSKMTLKMLEDEFDSAFSVSGGTKQKAITFFLKAAKFADMPLSPYLLSQLRATRKKRAPKQRSQHENGVAETNHVAIPAGSTSDTHVVHLASGGTMTVTITANPFKMPQEDREFVFSVIDKLQDYEGRHSSQELEEEEEEES